MTPPTTTGESATGLLSSQSQADGSLMVSLSGRLDANTTGTIWREALQLIRDKKPQRLILDGHALEYCDGAGIALLLELRRVQTAAGGTFTCQGLPDEVEQLLQLYGEAPVMPALAAADESLSPVERVGRAWVMGWNNFRALVTFVGELTVSLMQAAMHPRAVRWRDAWVIAERAGVDAIPIIGLIGFLRGLIMAFSRRFPC